MQINLIWAQAHQRVIGKNGLIPWHLPEDLLHFKAKTQGHPVVMGRKTWDSLPERFRPLPGRDNIVITRQEQWLNQRKEPTVFCASSLDAALTLCKAASEVWIIGGAEIYSLALPHATSVVVTEIDAAFAGDAFAPELGSEWCAVQRIENISATGLQFDFVTYQKSSMAVASHG